MSPPGAKKPPQQAGSFPLQLDRVGAARRSPSAAPVLRPQAPLHHAAADARRQRLPSGIGLDSQGVRAALIQRVRAGGVHNERVLAALAAVPRHQFVDTALATQAYEDTSLPIGLGQTISKPSVVARMVELLCEGAYARRAGDLGGVLEIGTGCGYQAAVLAQLSRRVMSVERLRPLYDKARENLVPWRGSSGIADIRLIYGDGRFGHPPNAPYESIIAAAGGDDVPQAWLDQMAVGARLVAPMRDPSNAAAQVLVVVDRREQGYQRSVHDGVRFVPLKSGVD